MDKNQPFEWVTDLTCFALATEELAKHTDKTATEWRSAFIDEALVPYKGKLPSGYEEAIKKLREQWAERNLPKLKAWKKSPRRTALNPAINC